MQALNLESSNIVDLSSGLLDGLSKIEAGVPVTRQKICDAIERMQAEPTIKSYPGLSFLLSQLADLVELRWPDGERAPALSRRELILISAAVKSIQMLGVAINHRYDLKIEPGCYIPILNGILADGK